MATKKLIEPKWAPGPRAQSNMVERHGAAQRFDRLQASLPDMSCFFNHIIINMGIDGDMIEKLPNNPPHFGRPWRMSVRMVGEVAELNGLE